MKPEDFFIECKNIATNFGLIEKTEGRKKQNVVIRKNLGMGWEMSSILLLLIL